MVVHIHRVGFAEGRKFGGKPTGWVRGSVGDVCASQKRNNGTSVRRPAGSDAFNKSSFDPAANLSFFLPPTTSPCSLSAQIWLLDAWRYPRFFCSCVLSFARPSVSARWLRSPRPAQRRESPPSMFFGRNKTPLYRCCKHCPRIGPRIVFWCALGLIALTP